MPAAKPLFDTVLSNPSLISNEEDRGVNAHFDLSLPSLDKRLIYTASKIYTDYTFPKKFCNYVGDGVILGAQPYKEQCDQIIKYAQEKTVVLAESSTELAGKQSTSTETGTTVPTTEQRTDLSTEQSNDSLTMSFSDPSTDTLTMSFSDPSTDSLTLSSSDSSADSLTMPSTDSSTKSSAPFTESVTKLSPEQLAQSIFAKLQPESLADSLVKPIEITAKPLGLVVSVVDYFESNGSVCLAPIASPLDWHQRNIKHYSLPMHDFSADVSVSAIIHVIDAMRECITDDKTVYIHCKAGKGRSYLIAAVYLAIYDESCAVPGDPEQSLKNAMKKISSQRKQVSLDNIKYQKALTAVQTIQKIIQIQTSTTLETEEKESKVNGTPQINLFFSSPKTKHAIAQFISFKQLAMYINTYIFTSSPVKIMSDFFKQIGDAKDAHWYLNYDDIFSHLLINNISDNNSDFTDKNDDNSVKQEDSDTRKKKESNENPLKHLLNNFRKELTEYVLKSGLEIMPLEKSKMEKLESFNNSQQESIPYPQKETYSPQEELKIPSCKRENSAHSDPIFDPEGNNSDVEFIEFSEIPEPQESKKTTPIGSPTHLSLYGLYAPSTSPTMKSASPTIEQENENRMGPC